MRYPPLRYYQAIARYGGGVSRTGLLRLDNKLLRERRAALEQLHQAIEKNKEDLLEEAIKVVRKVEVLLHEHGVMTLLHSVRVPGSSK